MQLHLLSNYCTKVDDFFVETVERKGLGHPDTLADIIAETFSDRYSLFCLKSFGVILNHWADKVTLVGAKSNISFGNGKIIRPIKVFQFGRVTPDLGNISVDVHNLFRESVEHVFKSVFRNDEMLDNIECYVDTHDGSGPDHPREFYDPQSKLEVQKLHSSIGANDTVICTAYAGYSKTEILTIELENLLNSPKFKSDFPETGYDVKVMTVRVGKKLDVVVCLPFKANQTPNMVFYKRRIEEVSSILLEKSKMICPEYTISIHMNTKDRESNSVYLTAFGTSLDKGGCGAVGRGNRYNGVITPMREMSIEAHSGKNPVYHAGKLYHAMAFDISRELFLLYSLENCVNIISQNGDPLEKPSFVFVKCHEDASEYEEEIREVVNSKLDNVRTFTRKIISEDPCCEHVNRPRSLYGDVFEQTGHRIGV